VSGPSAPFIPLEELEDTIRRMEAKLSQPTAARSVREAWQAYVRLVPRFERELGFSRRDVALAKSSALMVIQALDASSNSGKGPGTDD